MGSKIVFVVDVIRLKKCKIFGTVIKDAHNKIPIKRAKKEVFALFLRS